VKRVDFFKHNLKKVNLDDFKKVLKTNIITSGKFGEKVEEKLCKFFGCRYALLSNSWTNGAIAALLALNIQKGDEVIVPAMTFVATANVVEILGAKPVFVDCDPETLLIDQEKILKSLNKKTKAIFLVHLYGNMFDVCKLKKRLKKIKSKVKIIEDAAHSFESKLYGNKVGKYSDISIFSFYATKNITCAEGGAIITNDKKLFSLIKQTRSHGLSKNFTERFETKKYSHWDMNILGTKANLPDILAALLPEQIDDIYNNLKKRIKAFNFYKKELRSCNLRFQKINNGCMSSFHLFPIHVKTNIRDKLLNFMNENNIGCTVNYKSLTQLSYYKKKYNLKDKYFKNAIDWGKGTLSLPFYLNIPKKKQVHVIKVLKKGLKKFD
jgi:dTDP-4-amino-4,6-dideoxygalactose transaminase